ncbi:MAG: hypothetical protein JWM09_670 [Francisellaceae bacterium]|nr:hypothetical protein [Francisellaceae bacterium]
MKPSITIEYQTEEDYLKACHLSHQLDIPIRQYPADFILVIKDKFLSLSSLQNFPQFKPLTIDFLTGNLGYRLDLNRVKHEPLIKALGIKKEEPLSILDTTTGLGKDALLMAAAGCQMHLLERSPIVGVLFSNALNRAKEDPQFEPITQNIKTFEITDAIDFLKNLPPFPLYDIIYIDPMFPARTKSAFVKKEMIYLKTLLGDDIDSHKLLSEALIRAKKKVVVKRPRLSPYLAELNPSYSIKGKSNRFDIYICPHKTQKVSEF